MLRQITPSLCTQSERHGYIMTMMMMMMMRLRSFKIDILDFTNKRISKSDRVTIVVFTGGDQVTSKEGLVVTA